MYRKITFVAMVAAALVLNTGQTTAQNTPTDSSYRFTLVKELPHTSPKDQYRSSTCWSFSTVSMLESELLRTGKGEFDLSDMFVVRKQYADKAANYIRYQGTSNFGPGGACHDVLNNWKHYGVMPEEAFQGLNYGEKKHVHSEMDEAMKAYLEAVNKNPNRKLSTAWLQGFNGIADAYLGKPAEKFTYKGKEYTPKTFADMLALNPDDYIEISSFTHHPYFTAFTLEVPDNWAQGKVYNLPLDDMIRVIDHALDQGFTVAWASDISEKGFAWNKGFAVVPETEVTEMAGSEKAKWEKLTEKERLSQIYNLDKIVPERNITPEVRQAEFDNLKTTDDHGMHIVGYGTDQTGKRFYYVKNSWGTDNIYGGYFYVSVPFVKFKTTCFMVNRNALPSDLKKKLGL